RGEAWLDGEAGTIPMEPGVTISIPAGRVHGFRVIGDQPLVTYGIHTFGKRVVDYKDPEAGRAPHSTRGGKPMAIRRIDTTQPPGPRMSRAVVNGDTVYLAGLTAS